MHIELGTLSESSQVSLFLLEPEHVTQDYVSWLNDPQVNQYLECRFVMHTIASTKKFVRAMLDSPDHLFLGIRSHLLDRHVGNIKIGPINKHHRVGEMGIMVGDKKVWGNGVGSLAINLMSKIAQNHFMLRKITTGCYMSNIRSQRAFEKNGFNIEAVLKKHSLLNGQPEDCILMTKYLE
jgi:[ribosomal protein S5]-alanine N-acetyltransferase